MNSSTVILTLSLLLAPTVNAATPIYKISCKDAATSGSVRERVLDLDAKVLSYVDANQARLARNMAPTTVDYRCGQLNPLSAEDLNFEITLHGIWGQDILQIAPASIQPNVKTIAARLHTCEYDGDRSEFADAEMLCSLEEQPY